MQSPETPNHKEEIISDKDLTKSFSKEYGCELEGPWYKPEEIPTAQTIYIEKGNIAKEVGYLEDRLLNYVIKDQFDKDHAARRAFWDDVLEDKGREFFDKVKGMSKLRGANFTEASLAMQWIIEKLANQGFSEKADELKEILDLPTMKSSNEYAVMDLDEKVAYAREFDDRVYRFLEALS